MNDITFVVIGRNEGENLSRCFSSIKKINNNIVYVDSGSIDNSRLIAKNYKIEKIIHYYSKNSTASMSRVIGAKDVKTKYIQFVDGDMELDDEWIENARDRLEKNNNIAVVYGYLKEYKKNHNDYFYNYISTDEKNCESDYFLGAFMIRTDVYRKAGGFDARCPGEEERDLYVRIRYLSYQVWYIHKLMASHYNFKGKKKNIKFMLFSDSAAVTIFPPIKAIINRNWKSFLFVYRKLLFPLILDVISVIILLLGLKGLIIAFILQVLEFTYAFMIKRKGYFIFWKTGFINLHRVIKIYNRNISYKILNE